MKVGIIGYGTIGATLARAIQDGVAGDAKLVAVLDVHSKAPFDQKDGLPHYTNKLDHFLAAELDLVIEAASQTVLKEVAPHVLSHGRNLIAMSLGAFADEAFLAEIRRLASRHGARIILPAGAIGGLDALSAAAIGGLEEVTLTTTKPVSGIRAASGRGDPTREEMTEPTCLYEGPAAEAVRLFPKNVNVAAALSLAGIGFDKTTVRIIADPAATHNRHRIEARGLFGSLTIELTLLPSATNPRTSYLAALSAIHTVKTLTDPIHLGS